MSYIGNTVENQNYVPAIDYFNGNGSTTAFTLSRPVASVAAVQAVISNVPQNPGSAFTVSGSTITFTSAPPSGTANIYVYYTSPNTQIVQPGQGTVGTVQLADASVTAAKLASTTGTGAVALASLPSFTTTIGVGGATASASGTGITFPATQSASSDANTLDDYEEGTWTPSYTNIGSGTYGAREGKYTKIGKLVILECYFEMASLGSASGSAIISGIPFASVGTISTAQIWTNAWASSAQNVVGLMATTNVITLYNIVTSGSVNAITMANIGSSGNIIFNMSYTTAA